MGDPGSGVVLLDWFIHRHRLADGGGVIDAFLASVPALVDQDEHAEVLWGYLESDEIDPLPLLRACGRDPDGASEAFGRLLERPDFRWERDGESLLRAHKAAFYESDPQPRVVAFPEELAEAVRRS